MIKQRRTEQRKRRNKFTDKTMNMCKSRCTDERKRVRMCELMDINRMILIGLTIIIIISLSLAGCGSSSLTSRPVVEIAGYEKDTYKTETVQRGDIEPVLTLKLEPDNRKVTTYGSLEETMEVDEILVEVGDKVSAGDVLVSFTSKDDEERDEKLNDYNRRLSEDELLLEHYMRLSAIDTETDYLNDIEMLTNDIELMNIYIEELNELKSAMYLKCDEDGVVNYISDDLYKGVAPKMKALIKVVSGSDDFVATSDDDYEFTVGDEFEAESNVSKIPVRITDIAKDGDVRKLIFEVTAAGIALDETSVLTLNINKPIINDAVYVDSSAIVTKDGREFVFVVDDDGFESVAFVKTGSRFNEYIIITEGLNGGEQVVVN